MAPNGAHAQAYPAKSVRIVTGAAGGGNDTTARLVANLLTTSLGQNVVVDNRPGIGIIPAQTVAQAAPDGYTLLVYANTVWLLPFLQDRVPYDPVKDLAPVTLAAVLPQLLVTNPALNVRTVKELIALARAKPGELNFSTSGVGSVNHLAGELFKSMAKVNIVHVPYKGTALGTTDLIGGRVQLSFPTAASVAPHVKAGRLTALAITTAAPSVLFPNIPTMSAAGLPGYEAAAMLGMFAPAGTPAPVIERLQHDIARAVAQGETREAFLKAGMEPVGSTPDQLAATMKSDMTRMGRVIRDAGIRAE
jgi:tripartite-type tricarboxylate transporter receptor subunit TctC